MHLKATVIRVICFVSVFLITILSCGEGSRTASPSSEDSKQNAAQETVVQPVQAVCILGLCQIRFVRRDAGVVGFCQKLS